MIGESASGSLDNGQRLDPVTGEAAAEMLPGEEL